MSSPFPGMDPYIEHTEIWSDFHGDLAAEIRASLNSLIQPKYIARMTPRVTYEVVEIAETKNVRPDVGVWQPKAAPQATIATKVVIPPAPVQSLIVVEAPLRLFTVEVRLVETMELVTAIEILSPVNKQRSHAAFRAYQRKRQEILRSSAHLLELDLLRGGERPPLQQAVPNAPYYVVLSRAERRPQVEVWPIRLQDQLPLLPVPLLEMDPDAPLALGEIIAHIYVRGGYAALIDYHRPPPAPKLSETDVIWLDDWLRQQGVR